MSNIKKPLIDDNGEVLELEAEDFQRFKPATEVLPSSLQTKLGIRGRGPQVKPTKERITIRLSPEVVEAFKAKGAGWQSRIDEALKEWLVEHS